MSEIENISQYNAHTHNLNAAVTAILNLRTSDNWASVHYINDYVMGLMQEISARSFTRNLTIYELTTLTYANNVSRLISFYLRGAESG